MKVSSVAQMRAMDRAAGDSYGITELLLMENAGLAATAVLNNEIGISGRTFLVFCGSGNNGGDGFVVARKILSFRGKAKVFILGDPEKYTGCAKTNLEILSRLPIEVERLDSVQTVIYDLTHCDAVIDAMLGTGIDREVTGIYADVIGALNESSKTVLSLDIPSGVNGNTGHIMGCAVTADYTVSFGLPKLGNLLTPGYDLSGRLFVSRISFPPRLYDADDILVEVSSPPELPPRDSAGHKGTFGEALFIAGASGYYGAPYFSAMSFLKAGGGYSRLACPECIMPFVAGKGGEIVFIPQKQTSSGSISYQNRDALLNLAGKMDIVIIGPGLSLSDETGRLVRELAQMIEKPLLIDADGITAVSGDPEILKTRRAHTILTPHMGEMSRITGMPVSKIDEDRIAVLTRTSSELNSIIVLKGANSLIGYPDKRVLINVSGNSGMATPGSGDVLTGTIGAMFGLGLDIHSAVSKGVFIHGASGDLAAAEIGPDGITAQDILDFLPKALQIDREGLLEELYQGAEII